MTFPCELDIKVFARARDALEARIRELLLVHLQENQIISVKLKQSRAGKYHSLSCRVLAESRQQIDKVYIDLGRDPDVIMLL